MHFLSKKSLFGEIVWYNIRQLIKKGGCVDKNDNRVKLNHLYNEIFNREINKYLLMVKDCDDKVIHEESIIFLEAASNSINNSCSLIERDEYVDSLCLLRSAFEAIMFSLAIFFDADTYKIYKHYNFNIYKKVLKDRNTVTAKAMVENLDKKQRDPLQPGKIRSTVVKHYKEVYSEVFIECENEDEVKEELDNFYHYLCNFTHPSIVKTYAYKLQNDNSTLDEIRVIFKLNINFCKMLLLVALSFFANRNDVPDIYDLYAILFMSDISLITDVKNMRRLLKKYDDYLYLNLTKKYLKGNNEKIEEIKNELDEIKDSKDSITRLTGVMQEIIIKFDAIDLCKKYFQ